MKIHLKSAFSLCLFAFAVSAQAQIDNDSAGTPNIGERLFLETRFSQFFFAHSGGNANVVLTNGDPVMDATASIYGNLPGTFAGRAMNCRACHLVEEHLGIGNRSYADFATRSPIPSIGDNITQTPRNSISLVNSLLPRATPLFLHFDGQFASVQDLVIGTFTGRNFGWKPTEYSTAISNIVHIIRTDDGKGSLAQQYGGWSYAEAFAGLEQIESQYRIKGPFRLFDVKLTDRKAHDYVSDERIIQDVGALIQAYLETLVFSQDTNGQFNGSPYDTFLIKNGLPRASYTNESPIQYSRRLLQSVSNLPNPQYVTDPFDGHFELHTQTFQFGPQELAGLKIFLAENGDSTSPTPPAGRAQIGNCVACHAPPAFTDFLFHNTGVAQEEYDSVHGAGAFVALSVPSLSERLTHYDSFLPPTTNHPNAAGTFISPPNSNPPGQVDLGLWNVFANPDFPAPQAGLHQILPQLVPLPMASPGPQIASVVILGANVVISGVNGLPRWNYQVLATTNLSMSPANWEIISTQAFDNEGHFTVADSLRQAIGRFYTLLVTAPSEDLALERTIALFKTPNLRDLASSEPYFHTGTKNTIEDVIRFYKNFSNLARAGSVRNVDPRLSGISLDDSAVAPLAAFLRSLNEDYVDIPCPCQ